MDKETATDVMNIVLPRYRRLHASIDLVRSELDDEQRKRFCRSIGMVLGYMFADLLEPIFVEHPDLMPEDFKSDE